MKKTITSILTAMLTFALVFSCALPVFAASTTYSEVIGGEKQTTFDKYLVMDEGAEVPNVSFAYTITKGAGRSYSTTEGKFEVKPGVDEPVAPTITWDQAAEDSASTVEFRVTDTAILYANKADTDYVKNLGAGQKYAKHTATVDFTDVKFTEPGVYRYVITESASTENGITNDADSTRYLDVYVFDDSTETETKLKIAGYVLHANAGDVLANEEFGNAAGTGELGDVSSDYKSQGFTNVYSTFDLTFGKTVTGTQASRDKYFKFTVTIEGAVAGTKYVVSLDDDNNDATTDGYRADSQVPNNAATDTTYVGKTNVTELIVGSDGTVTKDFYLQHGQKIAIRGLAAGTKYTIEEDAEDYKPSATVNVNGEISSDYDSSKDGSIVKIISKDTGITGNTVVEFTNTRNGVIPTGILLSIAPFVGLMVVGAAGIILFTRKRKTSTTQK